MASKLPIQTSNLPSITEPENSASSAVESPARGKAMVAALHKRLRPTYPLVHSWEFWHDRQDRKRSPEPGAPAPSNSIPTAYLPKYEDRLVKLLDISDVKHFWELHNNFDVKNTLKLRDSVHLFKKGVKPLWEDPRNAKGGAWTFRVPKEQAPEFWMHICLLAIGEKLQEAVADPERTTFRDDICGVSYSVRFNSMLITIWNRDGDHEAGKQRLLEMVLEQVPEELIPKRNDLYYYKKHSSHAGFTAPLNSTAAGAEVSDATAKPTENTPAVVQSKPVDVEMGTEKNAISAAVSE